MLHKHAHQLLERLVCTSMNQQALRKELSQCALCGRYEVDKLSASQRLDLNLEKGRMRDELQVLRDKSNEMEIKMDRETNALKAAVEQSKNEVQQLCVLVTNPSCALCWICCYKPRWWYS